MVGKVKINILIGALATFLFSGCVLAPSSNTGQTNGNGDAGFVFSPTIRKTTDGGKTWEIKNKGIGRANTKNVNVLSFAINPSDNSNIYVGLRSGGILETTDGGETWRFINYQSEKVYGLTVSPLGGGTLYASGVWDGTGKMFRTQDRGEKWEEIYTNPSKGPLIISLMYDKRNPDLLYASSSDEQAFKSTDSGSSWQNMYVADSPILRIELDAGDSNLIYLLTDSGILYRSTDRGEEFTRMNEKITATMKGYGGNQFSTMAADPRVSGRLYLGGAGGLIVSNDAGETWYKIDILNDPRKFPVRTLAINPNRAGEIIYGAAQAVYKSADFGENWVTNQFTNNVNALRYDPADPDTIYAGFTTK